jgi:predicted enzyme related to lactoylglutathione lyase
MKIKHVYLSTENPDALVAFYSKLGLSVRFADGVRWTQFVSDGSAFCIADQTESVVPAGSNAVIVFEVDDLDASLKCATEAGAAIIGPIRDMGDHGRVAQIRDIESNVIQFLERTAPSAAR